MRGAKGHETLEAATSGFEHFRFVCNAYAPVWGVCAGRVPGLVLGAQNEILELPRVIALRDLVVVPEVEDVGDTIGLELKRSPRPLH